MKHILSFKVFEDGVATVSQGSVSGMGPVVSPQASTTPGNTNFSTPGTAKGGTTGSGDIGSGWDPTVTRAQSNELKSSRKRKKKKEKKK